MKSADKSGGARGVIKNKVMRQEMAYLSAGISRAGQEGNTTGVESSGRPEQNAAERMKNDVVDSALTGADVSAQATRAAYLRGKSIREKVLQKKDAGRLQDRASRERAGLPDTPNSCAPAQDNIIPTNAQRKERVRRQLFAEKATTKRAEKEAIRSGAGTVHESISPRLQHWQQTGRRQLFLQHAARQKLARQKAMPGGTRMAAMPHLTSPRPHSASTMRSYLQKGIGHALSKLAKAIGNTIKAAVQSLAALIGAGGIVLLLLLVIGAAAAIIGSPMGILFSDETGDPNAIPIASIVQEVNTDFAQSINEIVAAHPECDEVDIQYNYEAGRTWASYWPEVLAVFAVQTNMGDDGNVVVIDAANAQRIRDTFWEMHEITSWVETIEVEQEEAVDDAGESDMDAQTEESEEPATPQNRYILHITVSGKTVDEMADTHHFTTDQRDIMRQLLSDEMRPALLALCGGALGNATAGTLQWPLPGYTTISCQFGEPDAIKGRLHKGIDIPAPEDTPILAAHDGTVLIAGWNDSYGNQVLLDNGAGTSTRYAHMSATAVNAGEAVTAGQVIGYVGSTGNSTGNHLHLELQVNGTLVNVMDHINMYG